MSDLSRRRFVGVTLPSIPDGRRILFEDFQMQPGHSNPVLPEVCKPAPSAVQWEWQPDAEFLWFLPHRRNSPGCFSLAAAEIFFADRPLDEPSLPLPATRNDQSSVGCRRRIGSVGTIGLSSTFGVARLGELAATPVLRRWRCRTTRRHGRFYRTRRLAPLCRP